MNQSIKQLTAAIAAAQALARVKYDDGTRLEHLGVKELEIKCHHFKGCSENAQAVSSSGAQRQTCHRSGNNWCTNWLRKAHVAQADSTEPQKHNDWCWCQRNRHEQLGIECGHSNLG
jgi:hypothetical protein